MEATTLEPGTLVEHRYVVRRFIAAGGVAQVYAAQHRITQREVALKIPRTDVSGDPLVNDRLLREGHSVARAAHPGVVELVDAGQYNGAPYLVFELLRGRTLGGLLAARTRLGWEEVAFVGLKIAEIAGHCHSKGVVHRDLKPDNVFVLATGTFNLKLFDFGIAKLLPGAPDGEPSTKLTQVGSVVGTPEYMSPEALQMEAVQDHRVDIYSLGVILFELLTGSVPFEGRYADVLIQLSTKKLPSIAALRPGTPPNLVAAIERCLQRDPAARFQSMAEVVQTLTGALGSLQSVALGTAASPAAPPPTAPAGAEAAAADLEAALRPAAPAKRRFARAPYTTLAQLTLPSGEVIAGQVEEISEGGVQFIAPRGIASGERGDFRFAEPLTGRVLRTPATSRWTKAARAGRHATGFEFESVAEESRASIRKYVELMGGS